MSHRIATLHLGRSHSLDHLVGTPDERVGDGDAECLGGLEVNVQLNFGCLLDRQVSGLVALENAAGIDAGQTVCVRNGGSITQQTSSCRKLSIREDRRHRALERQRGELFAPAPKEWAAANHEPAYPQLDQLCEGSIKVTFGAGIQDMQLHRSEEHTSE